MKDLITLATLPLATAQQVADQIVQHLLTQNMRATSPDNPIQCMYRTDIGLMCAAGCLIAPSEYSPEMENKGWTLLCAAGYATQDHFDLIRAFQLVHDGNPPKDWGFLLSDVCEKYNLKYNPPKRVDLSTTAFDDLEE